VQYRKLGSSGLKVSVVGLGANNFGGRTDEARSIEVIQRALDAGVTTIDTADVYSQGQSEEIIGRALRGQRHRAELLTKVRFPMGQGPHDQGLSRKHRKRQVSVPSMRSRRQVEYPFPKARGEE